MPRIVCAFLLAILLCWSTAAAQTYSISGTVVEHGTNRPLKDAVVTIDPVQNRGSSVSYRTAEDGRFVFAQLQPGKFSLSAEKHGFPHQLFQEDQQYSTAIACGPGLDSTNIVFPLSPGGSVAGIVLDEENEAVRQAQISLFKKGVFAGSAATVLLQQRQTDSSGQFRFPHLKAGTYFVAVQARPWYAQNLPSAHQTTGNEAPVSGGELDVAYPLTYYAGAVDPTSASAIAVTEGSTSNLQIVLRAVPALHVQLTGLDAEPTHGGIGVMVMQVGLGGYPSFSQPQISFTDGVFEISGLAPGRYVLTPTTSRQDRAEQVTGTVVDLTGNGSINLGANSGFTLSGHMTFEGDGPPPARPLLLLHQPDTEAQSMISIESDGTLKRFNSSFLLPGRYQLSVRNAPGFYLKSVRANGVQMPNGEIDLSSASIQLSLVAAKGLTSIEGIAVKDDKPVGGAMVLLIPKDFACPDLIRRDQSDSDGTFTLPDVPPGGYTLLAIDNGHDLLYQDYSVMKPYLSHGQDVNAPLASGTPLKVTVQPRQTAPAPNAN